MRVRPLDTLLAIKAIALAPGLKTSDRIVGCLLIEHFNRRTDQCDPGLERLATLAGLSTRTVIRAVERLERGCLFRKIRHGGHLNRNTYVPAWSRFEELEARWRKTFAGSTTAVGDADALRHASHLPPDRAVNQTCGSNLQPRGLASRKKEGAGKAGVVSQSSGSAVEAAAERRWTDVLHRRLIGNPSLYGRVIAVIDEVMRSRATRAEVRQRGAGLRSILEDLRFAGIGLTAEEGESAERVLPGALPLAVLSTAEDRLVSGEKTRPDDA
jgi:hypothetical protein